MGISLICTTVFSSCASVEPQGSIYTSVILPEAASSAKGNKIGMSKATSVFGLFATGDASIETAKRNGGITKVATVDKKSENILGLIGTYTTIVTGQ